jgi:hypothetical protein
MEPLDSFSRGYFTFHVDFINSLHRLLSYSTGPLNTNPPYQARHLIATSNRNRRTPVPLGLTGSRLAVHHLISCLLLTIFQRTEEILEAIKDITRDHARRLARMAGKASRHRSRSVARLQQASHGEAPSTLQRRRRRSTLLWMDRQHREASR